MEFDFQILPKEEEHSWNSIFIKSEPLEYDSDEEKGKLNGENTQLDNLSNKVDNDSIKIQAHTSKLPIKSIQKLHYCRQCQREYKTARSLKRHMNTHAPVKGPKALPKKKHVCEICNKGCASPSKLQSHYHTHLEVKPFECDICKSRFRSYYTMKYHIMAHMQVGGRHKCPVCAKSYVRSSRLRDHMHSHSTIKPFECEVCKKSYSRKNDLKVHMISHDERKTVHCEICSKGFTSLSYLKIHTKLHSDDYSHVCNICGKRFHKISYLKIHMNRHTGVKPFECDICKKKFPSRASMKCHVVAHMEEGKSHKCPVCKNGFRKASMLKEHLRLHTGAKPYECKVCEKSFMRKGGLTQHMLTHDKKRPFLCDICHKGYKTHGHLKIHQKIHLNMDSFLCDICHKSFKRHGHLTLHKKMHSNDNDSRRVKAVETSSIDENVIFVKSEIQEEEEEDLQGQEMRPEKMIEKEKNPDHPSIGKEREETGSILKTEVKREICDDEDKHLQCQENKNLITSASKNTTSVSVKKEPRDILNLNSEIEFQDVKIES